MICFNVSQALSAAKTCAKQDNHLTQYCSGMQYTTVGFFRLIPVHHLRRKQEKTTSVSDFLT